ncbi:MAG: DUF2249 domain-containing protein [Colwellia sp.]|nr:DUF2249 domain-containing protein [Colwellia sp.]MCW8864433.1 DUF2249 domain-containing protein [Colwellia sp.]MCW9080846.1 DUF2249 domain-containing protein [Colwellia sp.]
MDIITLDVSELAPPEPMTLILSHLAQLSSQQCLQVKHRRQPYPLYEKLNSAGFAYHCVVHSQDDITLYIYHSTAQQAFESVFDLGE